MAFYLILLFLVAFFSAIVSNIKKGYVTSFCKVLTLSLLVVPAAIRYGIGVDYFNYVNIFDMIMYTPEFVFTEPGYWLLNYGVGYYGGNAQCVLAIAAFLTVFFVFKGLAEKRWYIYSVLFILMAYSWYFTTVRQLLAASIAFYALRILEEKNKKRIAFALIVFASSFHLSAMVYPLVYLLSRKMFILKIIALALFLIVFIITFVFSPYLVHYMKILVSLTPYGNYYIDSEWFLSPDSGSGLALLTRYILFFLLLLFFPLKQKNKLIFNIMLIYIVFEIMSFQITIMNRISRGLIFILFPAIYEIMQMQCKHRLCINGCIWFLISIYFIASLINQNPNLLPYKTFF